MKYVKIESGYRPQGRNEGSVEGWIFVETLRIKHNRGFFGVPANASGIEEAEKRCEKENYSDIMIYQGGKLVGKIV